MRQQQFFGDDHRRRLQPGAGEGKQGEGPLQEQIGFKLPGERRRIARPGRVKPGFAEKRFVNGNGELDERGLFPRSPVSGTGGGLQGVSNSR